MSVPAEWDYCRAKGILTLLNVIGRNLEVIVIPINGRLLPIRRRGCGGRRRLPYRIIVTFADNGLALEFDDLTGFDGAQQQRAFVRALPRRPGQHLLYDALFRRRIYGRAAGWCHHHHFGWQGLLDINVAAASAAARLKRFIATTKLEIASTAHHPSLIDAREEHAQFEQTFNETRTNPF